MPEPKIPLHASIVPATTGTRFPDDPSSKSPTMSVNEYKGASRRRAPSTLSIRPSIYVRLAPTIKKFDIGSATSTPAKARRQKSFGVRTRCVADIISGLWCCIHNMRARIWLAPTGSGAPHQHCRSSSEIFLSSDRASAAALLSCHVMAGAKAFPAISTNTSVLT